MKKALPALLLASIVAVSVTALTISNDNLELRLLERSGRFLLYAIQDGGSKKPLFLEGDPRTTVLAVVAGNRVYRMGDSFEFRQALWVEGNSASITWSSPSLSVTQSFTLQGASLAIDIRIVNSSEQDLRIGVRYLIDTYLGERGEHFTVDTLPVRNETDFLSNIPSAIVSSNGTDTQLVISTAGAGITKPDRIVLANWKRLSDAPWSFEVNQRRDFNNLPYSINDSAVALYYEPQVVPRNTARSISMRMKYEDPSRIASLSGDDGPSARLSEESIQLREKVIGEMIKIDSLITQIDALLNAATTPSQTAVDEITNSLNDLENRKKALIGQ